VKPHKVSETVPDNDYVSVASTLPSPFCSRGTAGSSDDQLKRLYVHYRIVQDIYIDIWDVECYRRGP